MVSRILSGFSREKPVDHVSGLAFSSQLKPWISPWAKLPSRGLHRGILPHKNCLGVRVYHLPTLRQEREVS